MKKEIIIKSNLVEINNFTKNNLTKEYLSWLNDSETTKYSQQRFVKHTKSSILNYYNEQKKSSRLFFAFYSLEDKKKIHIGNIGVIIDKIDMVADLSILLGNKNYLRKNFATHAWILIMEYLFTKKNIRIVTAGTLSVNKPMINLLSKSMMKIDAILKKRKIWNNKEVDIVMSSIDILRYRKKIKNAKLFLKNL